MGNSIKYNTSAESNALNTGDFWIGTGDVGKGPTFDGTLIIQTSATVNAIVISNPVNQFPNNYDVDNSGTHTFTQASSELTTNGSGTGLVLSIGSTTIAGGGADDWFIKPANIAVTNGGSNYSIGDKIEISAGVINAKFSANQTNKIVITLDESMFTAGFWNAINSSNIANNYPDGYTIYINKSIQGPSILVASTDAELIAIINEIEGTSYTNVNDCLNDYLNQDDRFIINKYLGPTVTEGLKFYADASLVPSYPRNGTSWKGLIDDINSTLINGPTYNTVGAINFDGDNDYVDVDSSIPLGNPCTVTALINHESEGGDVIFGPLANGADNWFGMTVSNSNNVLEVFGCSAADTNTFSLKSSNLVNIVSDGTRWYDVACTIDGSTAKLYINGLEVASVTKTFTIAGWTSTANIGKRGGISQKFWDGDISKVLGYNRVLTSSEMLQNYYQSKIVTDGLIYAIDAGSLVSYESPLTTVYSLIGENDGTLVGGVAYSNSNNGIWEFDGVYDKITLASSIDVGNGSSPWTISAWVKTTQNINGLGKGSVISNNASGPVYSMMGINSGKIVYWHYNAGWIQNLGTITVNDDKWHQLTWVNYSDATMDMYVDGVLDTSIADSSINTGNTNRLDVIGGSWAGFFDGNIANPQIYNTSLTSEKVSQNFSALSGRFSNIPPAPQA